LAGSARSDVPLVTPISRPPFRRPRDRRICGNEIAELDGYEGWAEADIVRSRRRGIGDREIDLTIFHGAYDVRNALEGDVFGGYLQPAGELLSEVVRQAVALPGGGVDDHRGRAARIDADAQTARRGQQFFHCTGIGRKPGQRGHSDAGKSALRAKQEVLLPGRMSERSSLIVSS
jgi:hypothetical protein